MFSAATAVLACWNKVDMPQELRGNGFEDFWRKCLESLEQYTSTISASARAIEILKAMRQQVDIISKGKSQSSFLAMCIHTTQPRRKAKRTKTSVLRAAVQSWMPPSEFPSTTTFDHLVSDLLQTHASSSGSPVIDEISLTWFEQCLADVDWPMIGRRPMDGETII